MAYVDLNTIHNPATGTVAPAAWGDQIRDNEEFLIDPPACSISDVAANVATATLVVLGATATENFDNDAMHSDVSNRSRITIQTPGRYLFLGNIATDSFVGIANSFLRASFQVDGTTPVGGHQIKNNSAATQPVRLPLVRSLVLTAGQYVEMTCQHNLGGTIQVTLDELVVLFLTR